MTDRAEIWLEDLGVRFVEVRFWDGEKWFAERHVDDWDTIDETVAMALIRATGARYAVFPRHHRWCLRTLRKPGQSTRYYDSREAAEMVAMHNG